MLRMMELDKVRIIATEKTIRAITRLRITEIYIVILVIRMEIMLKVNCLFWRKHNDVIN